MRLSEVDSAIDSVANPQDAEGAILTAVDDYPDYWYAHFRLGELLMHEGDPEGAMDAWMDAFDLMDADDFDRSFIKVANHLEKYISETIWYDPDNLHIDNLDDLAYVIFMDFPEKRCEDTDLLIVLLKRMNLHLDDVRHVRYLVDLLDVSSLLVRLYFDMNVEIRSHMYACDILLGIGSMVILKSMPMVEGCRDSEESLRTIGIVSEIISLFTKIRDCIFEEVMCRSKEEVDAIVMGWSRRCTDSYRMHLHRALDLSLMVHDSWKMSPEALQEERDMEIERYVKTFFGSS